MPRRLGPEDSGLPAVLRLIQSEFAYMEGVIDPPSSMHRLTLADLAQDGVEVWAIGSPPVACVVLTPKNDALYLGKLAVRSDERGKGHARALIDLALRRARSLGLPALECQTRVELTANHAIFETMGFARTAATAHAGYDRPTSYTYHKEVQP